VQASAANVTGGERRCYGTRHVTRERATTHAATQSVSELNRRKERRRGKRAAQPRQLAMTGVTRLLPLE
jgi:hypothetical protein